ncbi:unnamed protein product [Closterium sp. NIES-54]
MFVQGGKQEAPPAPSRKPRNPHSQTSQDFDNNSEGRRSRSFARRSYDSSASPAASSTPPTDAFAKMRLPTSSSVDEKRDAAGQSHDHDHLVDSPDKVTSKWSKADWQDIISALETASKGCHKCKDSSANPPLASALRLVSQLKAGGNHNHTDTHSSSGTSPRPNSRASFPDMHGAMTDMGPSACPYLGGGGKAGGGGGGGDAGEGGPRVAGLVRTHSGASSNTDSLMTGTTHSVGGGAGGGGGSNVSAADLLNRRMLLMITRAHELYAKDTTPNGSKVADFLLSQLLELTQSPAGFICSAVRKPDGAVSLKTHSITNFAWTRELRLWYTENAAKGLVFSNMNTLFGHVSAPPRPPSLLFPPRPLALLALLPPSPLPA